MSSIATRDCLVIRENKHLFKDLVAFMDKRGLDPVSLFVRSGEKNNIATSAKAPPECELSIYYVISQLVVYQADKICQLIGDLVQR